MLHLQPSHLSIDMKGNVGFGIITAVDSDEFVSKFASTCGIEKGRRYFDIH